ncbi:MAG: hypothetical protein SO135_06115 [Sphaerochaetaceae bacterium]|jgi:hypothetical protein|nr:hypothetical protein [Sphaerochaetaceae bacterium]
MSEISEAAVSALFIFSFQGHLGSVSVVEFIAIALLHYRKTSHSFMISYHRARVTGIIDGFLFDYFCDMESNQFVHSTKKTKTYFIETIMG